MAGKSRRILRGALAKQPPNTRRKADTNSHGDAVNRKGDWEGKAHRSKGLRAEQRDKKGIDEVKHQDRHHTEYGRYGHGAQCVCYRGR